MLGANRSEVSSASRILLFCINSIWLSYRSKFGILRRYSISLRLGDDSFFTTGIAVSIYFPVLGWISNTAWVVFRAVLVVYDPSFETISCWLFLSCLMLDRFFEYLSWALLAVKVDWLNFNSLNSFSSSSDFCTSVNTMLNYYFSPFIMSMRSLDSVIDGLFPSGDYFGLMSAYFRIGIFSVYSSYGIFSLVGLSERVMKDWFWGYLLLFFVFLFRSKSEIFYNIVNSATFWTWVI